MAPYQYYQTLSIRHFVICLLVAIPTFGDLTLSTLFNQVSAQSAETPKRKKLAKLIEPTEAQLDAAKTAYAKHGGKYIESHDPAMVETFSPHIFDFRGATDDDIDGLPDLPFNFGVSCRGSNLTEIELKRIGELKNVTLIDLSQSKITDSALKNFSNAKSLRYLSLEHTHVTDAGLENLHPLTEMQVLVLGNTKNVTPSMKLKPTPVTEAGVEKFRKALPECRIYR